MKRWRFRGLNQSMKSNFQEIVAGVESLVKFEYPGVWNRYALSEVYSFAISMLGSIIESETNLQIINKNVPKEPSYTIPFATQVNVLELDLKGINVISSPWRQSKFVLALQSLFTAGFIREWNTTNGRFYEELNLAIIDNGKHHITVGRLYKEGTAKLATLSLQSTFHKITTDGVWWYEDGKKDSRVGDYRFAAMYELARRRAAMLHDTPRAIRPSTPEEPVSVPDADDDNACWQLYHEMKLLQRENYALKMDNELKDREIEKLQHSSSGG
ncbi:hypothetical protein CE91St41_24310 [Oscillospiraceae bacterium]|nr:hypothetical protein CE91St40_13230 [Oscillospiraceae bacterium]BDF75542.1 hypothetical protein CE91St41_24310 [Oscillospiraceae bacterium]